MLQSVLKARAFENCSKSVAISNDYEKVHAHSIAPLRSFIYPSHLLPCECVYEYWVNTGKKSVGVVEDVEEHAGDAYTYSTSTRPSRVTETLKNLP